MRVCFTPSSPGLLHHPLLHIARSTMRKRRVAKPPSARRSTPFLTTLRTLPKATQLPLKPLLVSSLLLATLYFIYTFSNAPTHIPSATMPRLSAPVLQPRILHEYPHDPFAFTQGLVFHNSALYESTGLLKHSSVREVAVETGHVLRRHNLAENEFGEGLALVNSGKHLVQVLWKVGRGFLYDVETLEQLHEFRYDGDGWGLAAVRGSSNRVYLSDGTDTIKVYELEGGQFKHVSSFVVRDGEQTVAFLNELEMVRDELWANVWSSDFVARIDPKTGVVISWIDLRNLLRHTEIPDAHQIDVLNGIAYDSERDVVYVTGKNWPSLFAINLTDVKVADSIHSLTDPFFLDPARASAIHDQAFGYY